jgi:hypothetical protein
MRWDALVVSILTIVVVLLSWLEPAAAHGWDSSIYRASGAPLHLETSSPPDSAQLVSPPDTATDVNLSPALEVIVSDPDGDTLTVEFYGRPVSPSDTSSFTIIHLPDTQYYTGSVNGGSPEMFRQQTSWIVNNTAGRNIVYVAHVGDITNGGDYEPIEWLESWFAMSLLEDSTTTGMPCGLPYSISVGNHDQAPCGDPTGTTIYYNQYYGSAHFDGRPYYGGHFSTNNNNSYTLFSAGGLDFIVITMEYDPLPDIDVLAWADVQLRAHPNRRAIVNCHDLLEYGNPAIFSSQGQAVYDALKANPNLFMMLCGHNTECRRSDTYDGRTIHTLLANYQDRPNGGDGWLRIIEIVPNEGEMHFSTYSPTLGQYETDWSSEFTLSCDLLPSQEWQLVGTMAEVPSGSTATAVWADRAPFTEYEWYAVVSDGDSATTGPTWSFTTGNGPPAAKLISPCGGEWLAIGSPDSIEWCAADDIAVTSIDLLLSRTGIGGTYEAIATGLPNTGLFEWTVSGPETDQAVIKVVAYDGDGKSGEATTDSTFRISDISGVEHAHAGGFALRVLSAVPSNGCGQFAIAVPYEAHVNLIVLDVKGRQVAVIADRVFGAGQHTLSWNGRARNGKVSPGIYFLRMEAPDQLINRKLVLLR